MAAEFEVVQEQLAAAAANRNRTLNRTIDAAVREATGGALAIVTADVNAIGKAMAADISGQLALILNEFADSLGTAVRNRPGRITQMFQEVGEAAQRATVAAYIEQHGHAVSYRWQDSGRYRRFSNKVLQEALESPGLFRAAPDGLSFVIGSFLDQRAKQWYRLNFGAGGRGSEAPPISRMEFASGASLPGLFLDGKPSAAFTIPPGFFTNQAFPSTPNFGRLGGSTGGSGRNFYPSALLKGGSAEISRREGARVTKGIRGTRYLDAGVNEINRQLPVAMDKLIVEWVGEALETTTGRGPSGPLAASANATSTRALTSLNSRIKAASRALLAR